MCGIFGYVGSVEKPASFILDGLRSLEYRGYDSWGIAVLSKKKLRRERHVGKIGLESTSLPKSSTSMGHTRWATHGGVSVTNAHPHISCDGRFAVIHNGIIENEQELRKHLLSKGHTLHSQTDSELIAHLFEESAVSNDSLWHVMSKVVSRLSGAFAIGVIDRDRPNELVLARFGGPLVVGLTDGYKLFASDPSALLPFTKKVIYLKDREIVWITPREVDIRSFENHKRTSTVTTLDWDLEKTKRGGYEHFMLKEIMEQPLSVSETIRGRVSEGGLVKLGGLESLTPQLRDIEFIRLVASGTAYYASLYGSMAIQGLTDIACEAWVASEFKYISVNWPSNSASWFVSQSGETADVLGALEKAKKDHILSLGLVNVVGSSIAQRTKAGVYLHAGPEIAVASTKAFTSQLAALLLISCWLSQLIDVDRNPKVRLIAQELLSLSQAVSRTLLLRKEVKKLVRSLRGSSQIYFYGRGFNYPVALEGALKLREVAYLNTIGLPTGELKHGPISAMDKKRPAIVIAPFDHVTPKNRSSVQELRARRIPTIVITDTKGAKYFSDVADTLIATPSIHPMISPVLMAIVVQLIAYEMGVLLGRPIDKPRNLAKSVTVE